MEKIEEQLHRLSRHEVPNTLHQTIMREVTYRRLRPILFSVFGILVINFLFSLWSIHSTLLHAEFADMMNDFFEVFSFNLTFINTILGSFFEIVSPALVFSAFVSLAGAAYTAKKISFYRFAKA